MKTNSFFVIMSMLLIAIVAFFDSPQNFQQENPITSLPVFAEETETASEEEEEGLKHLTKSFENKLVGTAAIDGYLVEVYQEFEIFTDDEGNIIESKPTSEYDYLRYKR
ncbi:hypothetical protein [Metabacillus arenae]|uniref:Uncharacterized protein n=1 Tax=Metabacillus arenae TaxID=2771434 RepID=A0A926RXD5_9BACI|nr:hypothetical protein [Metabacillus arenae]MBD1380555.1 hypothetical protein [Metabacillus arenae]